jgi:hypothetical protein
MTSDNLLFVAQYLRSRAGEDGRCPDPLSVADMLRLAFMLEGYAEQVGAMEERPIPPRLRVIAGGKR